MSGFHEAVSAVKAAAVAGLSNSLEVRSDTVLAENGNG